jgi:hypothetical protein
LIATSSDGWHDSKNLFEKKSKNNHFEKANNSHLEISVSGTFLTNTEVSAIEIKADLPPQYLHASICRLPKPALAFHCSNMRGLLR